MRSIEMLKSGLVGTLAAAALGVALLGGGTGETVPPDPSWDTVAAAQEDPSWDLPPKPGQA